MAAASWVAEAEVPPGSGSGASGLRAGAPVRKRPVAHRRRAEQPELMGAAVDPPILTPVTTAPLLFALGGSERLGAAVAAAAGVAMGAVEEREFERGEHKARPLVAVRNRDTAILHCVHGDVVGPAVNDRLLRLWFFAAALRDAGARSVTAVVPYLPYSRKDRRTKARDPVGSRYVAQHFEASGIDRVVAIEPHNVAAFENAFRIEAVALPLAPLVAEWLAARHGDGPLTIVSPDVGGTRRAQQLRELLARRHRIEAGLAFVEKRRSAGILSGELLVGEVAGTRCVIVDDLVSSGSTLARAARACRSGGARSVAVAVAHALLLPSATALLREADCEHILVTDSVALPPGLASQLPLEVLGLAPYLGAALRRVWAGGSLSELAGFE
jgi:ribose-phosphate pyrophosphokinase